MLFNFNFGDLSLSLELTNALDWLVPHQGSSGVYFPVLGFQACTQPFTQLLGVRTQTFAFARPALYTLRLSSAPVSPYFYTCQKRNN